MGVPTANVETAPDAAMPARGVYAGYVVTGAERFTAAVNVGHAPTFEEHGVTDPPRVEAFLLDYPGDPLYGKRVRVVFLERLRDERRFDGPEQLVAQIDDDVARTRAIAAAAGI
jgi:riboflavin kinase/FMN adenylyltransferase